MFCLELIHLVSLALEMKIDLLKAAKTRAIRANYFGSKEEMFTLTTNLNALIK